MTGVEQEEEKTKGADREGAGDAIAMAIIKEDEAEGAGNSVGEQRNDVKESLVSVGVGEVVNVGKQKEDLSAGEEEDGAGEEEGGMNAETDHPIQQRRGCIFEEEISITKATETRE